jgi:uncharacterized protein YprB with RNaseH-like and TPR domain/DNA-directed RNA polymerase subunit RPC12/RpoP
MSVVSADRCVRSLFCYLSAYCFYKQKWECFPIKLTVAYVCQKCSKSFSQSDFENSNYCRECGGFLLKNYVVAVPQATSEGAPVETSKKRGDLARVAENLRRRSEEAKEYEILPEPAKLRHPQGMGSDGWILGCELDDALKLKADLMLKFEGKSLVEAIHGETLSNEQGECYCIRQNHRILFKRATVEDCRRRLLLDLKLLPGIGSARELALKKQGYQTIENLTGHLKWRKPAAEFLQLVDSMDVMALEARLRRTLPKSHPLAHYLAGFCRDRDLAIIDIETLGLFGRPIILVGLAEASKRGVCTHQFLARDVSEEAAAIWELARRLGSGSAIISFNGRCFDVPFILERMAYYGLGFEEIFENPHFDMLHFARRALRGKLASCRLESVEKYLGISRNINVPGALVPEFYDSYQRSGNVGPLVAIVEHNKQDLVTLTHLFCSLYREWDQ